MKILHTVESYWPSLGGMPEVVAQLSERLATRGHEVVVATSGHSKRTTSDRNGVKIVSFDISGNSVRGYSGSEAERERYQNLILDGGFDVVTVFAAQQWSVDLFLPIIDKVGSKKVFVPTGFSRLNDPLYAKYYSTLPGKMAQFDMNIFLSNSYQDIEFARKYGITKLTVISNGADEREFGDLNINKTNVRNALKIPEKHFLILHVGSHTGKKGHREVVEIFSRAKIKNATLLIVGNSFGRGCTYGCLLRKLIGNLSPRLRAANKKIIITSLSREETVGVYKTADLFLFPSNIECSPIVLFESAAAAVPFLSSDAGNSAELAKWTGGGLILPTAERQSGYVTVDIQKSAMILEDLYENEAYREQLGRAGRAAWLERFTWDRISHEYENLYLKLLS